MTIPSIPPSELFTNNAYFYANNSFTLGSLQQPVNATTLITIDYTQLDITILNTAIFSFLVDQGNGPPILITDTVLNSGVLTFLISGGIPEVTYSLTINIEHDADQFRSDTLSVNVFDLSNQFYSTAVTPVSNTVGQPMIGSSLAFFNTGPRFFVSSAAPTGANVMDEWYNDLTGDVGQLVTDGSNVWWQVPSYVPGGLPKPTGPNLVLVTDMMPPYNYKTANINSLIQLTNISLDMGTF
jgi:hypothetical protein